MKIPAAQIYFSEPDKKEICERIRQVLTSGRLTLGKYGELFEKKFARFLGLHHAVVVNSGTSAIEILLRCFSINNGEVIVPTNTFFSTAAAVIHAGGEVRFADIDSKTFSLSLSLLKKQIRKNTRGVIIVHVGGLVSPEIENIKKFCEEKNFFLLEDAAHAHGSQYKGRYAGTFGDGATFSFYPTKVITSAEGGMVVTNNKKIFQDARIYRDQGKASFGKNFHLKLGYNWRMSEPQAIIGLAQLKHLKEFIKRRQKIAHFYNQGIRKIPKIRSLKIPKGSISNYYKYIVILERGLNREKLKKILKEKYDISLSGEVYEIPCHLQPVFKDYRREKLKIAEDICQRHICLPISGVMTIEQAKYVLLSLRKTFKFL